jgi:hypothetical protein
LFLEKMSERYHLSLEQANLMRRNCKFSVMEKDRLDYQYGPREVTLIPM